MGIECVVRGNWGEATDALREYAVRRLLFSVRRLRHLVRHLTIRLVDENGPRRGVDSRCSIVADLANGDALFVEATAAWPFASITLATTRLSAALHRNAERHALRRGGGEVSHPARRTR